MVRQGYWGVAPSQSYHLQIVSYLNEPQLGKKSRYSVTFIGGRTLAGWSIPNHLQVKSEAHADNIKLSVYFSTMFKMFKGFVDSAQWLRKEWHYEQIQVRVWITKSLPNIFP